MSWTTRYHGGVMDNENAAKRGVETFAKWTPPAGLKFEQFVGRIDGNGGFAVVETDNVADLLDGTAKFAPANEFQIYPVVDIADWIQAATDGIGFRESIS
ncbi:MAG: DUF3303 family protein [Mycobacterium sp.]